MSDFAMENVKVMLLSVTLPLSLVIGACSVWIVSVLRQGQGGTGKRDPAS